MFARITTRTLLRMCALLAIPLVLGGLLLLSSRVQAAPDEPAANPHPCTIANIAVYENRIHVRCVDPVALVKTATPLTFYMVYYFAAPGDADNMIETNRYLTLLNTAYALNKTVLVGYDTFADLNPDGCLIDDCRGINSLILELP
jgi:hypothetical protein